MTDRHKGGAERERPDFARTADLATETAGPGSLVKNSLGMEFRLIPGGSLRCGWTAKNDFDEDIEHLKTMTVSRPFYLGRYETTQEQWAALMGYNPARFRGRANPVETVSWEETREFIKKLNSKEGTDKYRLPTEAEWEYAARTGGETDWLFTAGPGAWKDHAWFNENSNRTTHPVGGKKPSPWGLYDMYGNVWEWVADWDGEGWFQEGTATDPQGPSFGVARVFRGGGWNSDIQRLARRDAGAPGFRLAALGFRLAFYPAL